MNALARENQMSATELAVVIESRMESPEPQTTIVNYLKTRESKPLTVRDEKELKKLTGDEELYISKQYGMTSIKWGGGNKGGCLFIAHSEKNVTIDTAKILEKNVCYFGAAEARNEQRKLALADPDTLARVVSLAKQFLCAQSELAWLMDYGMPLSPDSHAIRVALGLEKAK